MKLVWLIKICLHETYSKVLISKHLSDSFPIQNGLQEDALSPLLFYFALEYAIRKVQEIGGTEFECETSAFCWRHESTGDNIETIKKNTETLVDAI
jgi:hypothetical protein